MKLKKILAVLALIGVTSMFAGGAKDIGLLIEKINNTTNQKQKSVLLKQLDDELDTMDRKDLPRAQEIINNKLNQKAIMK